MTKIKSWQGFGREVRSKGCHLLARLDEFPESVLVTGCQRSGTTALARIITTSDGMVNYWFGKDDELDAALILAGEVNHAPEGRYCFQTTYLNECYSEYFDHANGHKIIWVIRNPYSVVYSMLKNWGRFAFNELFEACGLSYLPDEHKKRYSRFGKLAIPRIRRACFSYIGKTTQLFEIRKGLWKDNILIVDYDNLVINKDLVLPKIYRFIGLSYQQRYANKLNSGNINKAQKLSHIERKTIKQLCVPIYDQAKRLSQEL